MTPQPTNPPSEEETVCLEKLKREHELRLLSPTETNWLLNYTTRLIAEVRRLRTFGLWKEGE